MAKLVKIPMTGWDKFNKTVMAFPESAYEHAFDSTFEKSVFADKNCTLRIALRIFYRQINPWQVTDPMMRLIAANLGVPAPATGTVGMHADADDTPHLIKEWTAAEWGSFTSAVKSQASLWDGKFWLMPPDDFSHFDIVEGSWTAASGSKTTRPNVKCEFRLEIAPGSSTAHMSVDVVNLLGPGFFRSHSRLYNTTDTTVRPNTKPDWNSRAVNTSQPVIAHEIGHAIGLPHIGQSRSLAQCGLAIVMGKAFHADAIPALYKGGSNADVCYGTRGTAGDIENIMGAGSTFSRENAAPWLNRLPHHLNLGVYELAGVLSSFAKWKVLMTDTAPMNRVSRPRRAG